MCIARNYSIWLRFAQIAEHRRFGFPSVARILDHLIDKAGDKAALYERRTDALDERNPFVIGDRGARNEKLLVTSGRSFSRAADAVVVHSLNITLKLVLRYTNFPDMTQLSEYDATFLKRRGFPNMT